MCIRDRHIATKIDEVKDQPPATISQKVREEFANYFLQDKQKCPSCGGKLVLKIGKFGAIVGCENYPTCKEIANIDQSNIVSEKKSLGHLNEAEIVLKNGPYGPYIEVIAEDKPKRVPIPKIWQGQDLSEQQAQFLASLPKEISTYNGQKITLSIGRFGPFIKHGSTFVSIKDPMNIELNLAITLIERKAKKTDAGADTNKPTRWKKASSQTRQKTSSSVTTEEASKKTTKTKIKAVRKKPA